MFFPSQSFSTDSRRKITYESSVIDHEMNQNKNFVLCQNIVNYAKHNDQGDHMVYLLMDYSLHSFNYKYKEKEYF